MAMRTAARNDAEAVAQPKPTSGVASALNLLSDRSFRFYWLATIPWNIARWTEIVVTGWLMLELTNSPWDVALLGFCRSAALPIVGPFAGVIADRVDRLTLIRLAQMLNIVVTLTLTVLVVSGSVAAPHLFAGSLLLGLSWALDWPARRALMVDLVGREALVQSTVLDNLSMNVSKIVGPALAGVILALAGPGLGIATLLLCFSASLALFWLVKRPKREQASIGGSPLRSLAAGLTYAVREPVILGVLAITVLMNCLVFPYTQLLPVMARDVLRVGPVELGWLAAAQGIGALLGLPLILRSRGGGPHGWFFIVGSAGLAATLLGFALCPWYWPALLLLIVGGIGHAGFGTMQSTLLLGYASPEMRGRALGVLTLAIGASPIGALMMGLLAERWNAAVSIGLCAALGLLTVALVGALVPRLRAAGQPG
jgi:MFS family permease